MKRVCVTGHRPDKLWGYDILSPNYLILRKKFKELLINGEYEEGVSGMALGTDMVFAMAVLELRSEGYNIKLRCAIPCLKQYIKWNPDDIMLWKSIVMQADTKVLVTNSLYTPYCMPKRNRYMVDTVDDVMALYNGDETGGTADCVKYAESQNKNIIVLNPNDVDKWGVNYGI